MMLDAALELAGNGWSVFPCIEHDTPKAKRPYTTHGFKDATRDPETIASWWRRWPAALIGAPVPESLLVLDFDPRHGGRVETLEAEAGPLPPTLTVWSGRGDGGRHLFYQRPPGRLTSTRLPVGVDLKGQGGYTILPPSRHPSTGQPYRWEQHPVRVLPARVVALLHRPVRCVPPRASSQSLPSRMGGLLSAVLGASDGNRNKVFYWACRRAIEAGASSTSDLQPLIQAAHTAGLTDLRPRGLTEAQQTAESALRGAGVIK